MWWTRHRVAVGVVVADDDVRHYLSFWLDPKRIRWIQLVAFGDLVRLKKRLSIREFVFANPPTFFLWTAIAQFASFVDFLRSNRRDFPDKFVACD